MARRCTYTVSVSFEVEDWTPISENSYESDIAWVLEHQVVKLVRDYPKARLRVTRQSNY